MKTSVIRNILVEPRCPDYGGSTVAVNLVNDTISCQLNMRSKDKVSRLAADPTGLLGGDKEVLLYEYSHSMFPSLLELLPIPISPLNDFFTCNYCVKRWHLTARSYHLSLLLRMRLINH